MIESLIQFLQTVVLPLGPLGVFAASFIEEVIVPIPSSLIILAAGVTFLSGPFSLALIVKLILYIALPAALGITLGSLVVYGILYWGGENFVRRHGKWAGLSWDDVLRVEERLRRWKGDELAIIFLRAIPVIPSSAVDAFCGLFQYPIKKYLVLTFSGVFIRALILGILGWQAERFYLKYADIIDKFETLVLVVISAAVIGFIIYRHRKVKKGNITSS